MKKLFKILLVALLAMALVACGDKPNNNSDNSSENKQFTILPFELIQTFPFEASSFEEIENWVNQSKYNWIDTDDDPDGNYRITSPMHWDYCHIYLSKEPKVWMTLISYPDEGEQELFFEILSTELSNLGAVISTQEDQSQGDTDILVTEYTYNELTICLSAVIDTELDEGTFYLQIFETN